MDKVKRIFVEKKKGYDIEAGGLCREYARELGIVLKNMDIVDTVPISHFDIDEVLNKAEEVQRIRRRGIETVGFIFTALLVLTAFALLTLKFGTLFIIVSQAVISMNLPLVLLAARKMREAKEVLR
jgi:hypothetical protein